MSDFYEKTINSPYVNSISVKPNNVVGLYNHSVQDGHGQTHRINPEASTVILQSNMTARNNATSPVATNLYDGGQLEFRLEKGSTDLLDHIYLRYDLTSVEASATTDVQVSPLSINYIQVFGQNGADLLYQESGLQMWLSLCSELSETEWKSVDVRLGSDDSYAIKFQMAAASTKAFYLPITRLIKQAKLCPAGLDSELTIRLVFNTATQNVETAKGTPTCNSAYLLLRGSYEPVHVSNAKVKLYKSKSILTIPYLHPQSMSQIMTLAASSTYSVVLSGIKGLVSHIAFTLRTSPIPRLSAGDFKDLVQCFDIQSANGESLIGHYDICSDESQELLYPELFNNMFPTHSQFVLYSFNKNPTQSARDGTNHGHQPFTGFEKLTFNTKASGTYSSPIQVDIMAWTYSTAHITSGTIRSRKP